MTSCLILSLPLEIRQNIYDWASVRPTGSHLILKEFFEKIDTDIPRLPPTEVVLPVSGVAIVTDDPHLDEANIGNEDEVDEDGQEGWEDNDALSDSIDEEESLHEDGGGNETNSSDDVSDFDDTEVLPYPNSRSDNGRNTKYRHILPILQLSHCPPPIGLLGTCKQIHDEARSFYRKRAVLVIDVNKGFQHFSFFQETIDLLIRTPYSPLEQIRKVNLVITWDSEWLRAKSTPPDQKLERDQMFFFNYYFGERIQLMINLLQACPELQNVKIDYHDTEDTEASRSFMFQKLMDLQVAVISKNSVDDNGDRLPVEIELNQYFSQAGTAHARDSLLALRRTEFDHFLLSGLSMR
ncbi:uncharacterized protein PV09_00125 [Verruconis gallopava]|uniref:Uncharacterized protein n=1 Tax=Verruconis gallopava TaxID=253628 RepID=A0A0D1Z893_9PEZI|nr:uncharacterized protein PV09_00125 [Verruconis gallopava]KIW09197.1 hypothetical protein PV09_00125 [Verruconis gallopava]